jgi:2,5-diketo-D-gluconate reductase A
MDDRATESAVVSAVEAGYRLFDTAENYGNEIGVGRGLRASGVPAEELFVTTKFNKKWHGVKEAAEAFEQSRERLGVDIDLLLIHWPNPQQDRYVQAWEGLVQLLEQGSVKAIGTSNFKPSHLERIIAATGVAPDVNQIQLNPFTIRTAARSYHDEHGIVTEAWSPLGGSGADVVTESVVKEIAERHGKTPAQIVLRWHMELGVVTVPKSSDPERQRQNIDLFDFALAPEEVAAISALDRGESAAEDSDVFGH